MQTIFEFDINNQQEQYEIGKVAKQSNGAVLYKMGNCVILATVTVDYDHPVEEDFIPLTVQYIEKAYASAKIPGGFIKREQKPSEFETLTSRVIDRSLRPIFPKGFRYPVQITTIVLSVDKTIDLQVVALNASSAALYLSDLPIKQSVVGVRVAKIDNELIINPNFETLENSSLDLYLAGTDNDLLMIEMKSLKDDDKIGEDELLNAIEFGLNAINNATTAYREKFDTLEIERKEIELIVNSIDTDFKKSIRDNYENDINDAVKKLAKSERNSFLKDIAKKILDSENFGDDKDKILDAVDSIKRDIVRDMILNDKVRADGRGLKDVRPISIETNILPSAHSSCLFTRGETQALVVLTLGGERDGQMFERLAESKPLLENFMLHYNFPGFSVGEAKPLFAPGRRELGHGNLGKRALESTISKDYGKTVRVVSEILESNGSSSMATVCGGSIALKAANVPISGLVAGVAMGMVIDGEKYSILTDIMGLEDHDGDMDFKVAGTVNNITALQMDIKLGGIKLSILKEALYQAKEGREHILNIMEDSIKDIKYNKALPISEEFKIEPSQIIDIIGPAGKVIRAITEDFAVSIDLDKKSGLVRIDGSQDNVEKAKEAITKIVSSKESLAKVIDFMKLYKNGEVLEGIVRRITDFGAFIELPKGGEGLLHISKISRTRVNKVTDVLNENDEVKLKVLKISRDRIELTAVF